MGEHFRELHNYNALWAVYSVLNSAPIKQLKSVWNKIPKKHKQIHYHWIQIFSRDLNHRNLRALLRCNRDRPCIPLITVYLQDLIFIDQGNKDKTKKNLRKYGGSEKMTNFNKCVRIGDRIRNIQQYSRYPYSQIIEKRETQKILLLEFEKLKDLTDEQIWKMSTEINAQD
eukprot:242808_1